MPTRWKVAERMENLDVEREDLRCFLCGEAEDSIRHLILKCPFSYAIWSKSPWQINLDAFREIQICEWVQIVLHPHRQLGIPLEDQNFFQLFAVNAIDLIWSSKNRRVHDGKSYDAKELAQRVNKVSWEHKEAWAKKSIPASNLVWQLPLGDEVKVNIDVAIRDDFAVLVAILQDNTGAIKDFKVAKIGVVTPLVGEAEAAKLGVALAYQAGHKNIILEGDSEIVIKAIKNAPKQMDWRIDSLILEILSVMRLMQSWKAT